MAMVAESMPKLKGLLRKLKLSDACRSLVLRMMITFILHSGRMSCSQAAGALATEPRHVAQLTRFLARPAELAATLIEQLPLPPGADVVVLADTVLQRAEKHAGRGPVSVPRICRRGRLDGNGHADGAVPGMVSRRTTGPAEAHQKGDGVVDSPTRLRPLPSPPFGEPTRRLAIHRRTSPIRRQHPKTQTPRRTSHPQRIPMQIMINDKNSASSKLARQVCVTRVRVRHRPRSVIAQTVADFIRLLPAFSGRW